MRRTVSASSSEPGRRRTRSVCSDLRCPFCELSFRSQVLAYQLPAEAEGEGSADAIAEAGNTALTCVNLDGKLSAVFGGKHPLDFLDEARQQAANIIVELCGTAGDADAVLFADEFIVRALVDVLEPPHRLTS